MPRLFEPDPEFSCYFKNLHQVFMYITDRCNLECEQCIYKPSISHFINEEIELETALDLLTTFRGIGASKVTFLGGEPTIYGHRQAGRPLLDLIEGTRKIGYEYIRLDTNGQKTKQFLGEPSFKKLDEIAFSLDGYSPDTNDPLRGKGTFIRVVDAIREAISVGYRVTITCCVQKLFLDRGPTGVLKLETMIRFAEDLGVHQINFHDLFKVGIPMDTWTGNFAPEPHEWMPVYDEVSRKMRERQFAISVRLPQCFVTKSEFARNPEFYGYCPVKLGERVMVHPNGTIRICSNLICTGYGVARYYDGRIEWDRSSGNETVGHDLTRHTPCTNRSRHRKYGDLVPVCFSFKPGQEEHVWQTRLDWDSRQSLESQKRALGQG
ncbi:radical SAM protein [Bradyrhizobium sp. IC3069]|uniref:radical SAM protein n=1 Tax=unclassified Bradyrhizobium TaxID=2631580 RepID=UPI001CD2662E|nr:MULTISPECIES: radical SAM protein [unclassified Bradyrhizobium]MCA1363687.1 radical SAM protein [Bradyrhizobium sp. IC4059]MCA1521248.1 radical SAM protein [Bradyrhizobium sp. IC3069]